MYPYSCSFELSRRHAFSQNLGKRKKFKPGSIKFHFSQYHFDTYILHAYVSHLSLNGLSIDWNILLISMCVRVGVCVCVLSSKTLHFLTLCLLFGLVHFYCFYPRFLCYTSCLKKGRESDSATASSSHYFFVFWPASISNIARAALSRGGEKRSSFLFLVKYQHIVFAFALFISGLFLFCSLALIHHPMNRNILVFCD